MRHIFTTLIACVLFGSAGAADQTPRYNIDADLGFSHDYGKQLAGAVLLLDVGMSPGVTFLTGWVDNGSSEGWAGGGSGLLHYTCVIPTSFSGVHNGKFTGNFGKDGSGNGGSPPVWHGAAQATAFKIVHTTQFQAPDGTPSDRTIVGICERVTLRTEPELDGVTWACSAGGIAPVAGATTVWKAPFTGSANATVTATYLGKTQSVGFSVLTPMGLTGVKTASEPIGQKIVGAGMSVRVTFQPTRVSYGGLNGYESDCPPTNRIGWFIEQSYRPPNHVVDPSDPHQWVGENNAHIVDTCQFTLPFTYQPPFPSSNGGGGGSFVWRIPTNIEDVDSPAITRILGLFDQTFTLFQDGEMHITKYGVTERHQYVP